MPDHSTSTALEAFVLLANGAKGAAAVNLIQQALEASGVYVFGELLDHPNIGALEKTDIGDGFYRLLKIFAFGTYTDYLKEASTLPPLSEPMSKKLRLLSIASMATKAKLLRYSDLQKELVRFFLGCEILGLVGILALGYFVNLNHPMTLSH